MTKRKIYISEDKLKSLIKEYVTQKCYHFCDYDTLMRILNSNRFVLRTNIVSKSEHWYQPNRRFFMSLTRNKHPMEGYSQFLTTSSFARLELDGDALNMNYRARPVNYFARGSEDLIYGSPTERKMYSSPKSMSVGNEYNDQVENEDRIFSSRPYIPNAYKYIKRIDVVIMDYDFEKSIQNLLTSINPKWYDKMHFYRTPYDLSVGEEIKNINFPTNQNSEVVDALDRNFDKEIPEVKILSTTALLMVSFLLNCVRAFSGEKMFNTVSFVLSVKYKYSIPTDLRNFLEVVPFRKQIMDYIRLLEKGKYNDAFYYAKKCENILEITIKELNTKYANNKYALRTIQAITDIFRRNNLYTTALVRGKKGDPNNKEIKNIVGQLFDLLQKNKK